MPFQLERFVTLLQTTLSTGMSSDSDPSMTLTSVTGLPSSGQIRALLSEGGNQEIVLATLPPAMGTTLNIQRRVEPVGGVQNKYQFNAGATVNFIYTADGLGNDPRSMSAVGDLETLDTGGKVIRLPGGSVGQSPAFSPLAHSTLTNFLQYTAHRGYSPMDFGAVADGTNHDLTELYGNTLPDSLLAAQADFPFVMSLSESRDRVALQQCLNLASRPDYTHAGKNVYIPAGQYYLDKPLTLTTTDGCTIRGDGKATQLRWHGAAANNAAFQIVSCQNCAFENFSLLSDSSAAPVLLDHFAESMNNVALTDHMMNTGPGWMAVNGTFWIQNNAVQPNSDNDGDMAVSQSGIADATISVVSTPAYTNGSNAERAGLVFRYSSPGNYWLLDWAADAGANGTLTLSKVVSGVVTSLASSNPGGNASGTPATLQVVCEHRDMVVYFNDVAQYTVTDYFNEGATYHGLRLGKVGSPGLKASWDDFQVAAPTYGILLTNTGASTDGLVSDANTFRGVTVSAAGLSYAVGIVFGGAGDNNNDLHVFESCTFAQYGMAGVLVFGGEAHFLRFHRSNFGGPSGQKTYGIWCVYGAYVHVDRCNLNVHQADVRLSQFYPGVCSVSYCNGEGSRRLLSVAGANCPVSVTGCRAALAPNPGDFVLDLAGGGTWRIQDNTFATGNSVQPRIQFFGGASGVVHTNNIYATGSGGPTWASTGGGAIVIGPLGTTGYTIYNLEDRGNQYYDPDGTGHSFDHVSHTPNVPAAITSNQPEYDPLPGYYQRWSSTQDVLINGMPGGGQGGAGFAGEVREIWNAGAYNITLVNQSSTAPRPPAKFLTSTGNDLVLGPGHAVLARYDTTINGGYGSWRVTPIGVSGT
jgi:hypothetical protein